MTVARNVAGLVGGAGCSPTAAPVPLGCLIAALALATEIGLFVAAALGAGDGPGTGLALLLAAGLLTARQGKIPAC